MRDRAWMLVVFLGSVVSCSDEEAGATRVWLLVHGEGAEGLASLRLVDVERGVVERTLAVPAELGSAHALAHDGTSLWVSGFSGLYELDPADGAVRSTLPEIETEGLAVDGDTLWYATTEPEAPGQMTRRLVQIDHAGVKLRELTVRTAVVNDVAFDGQSLYYAVNSATDPVVRVDPASGGEGIVAEPAALHQTLYTLGFDGRGLALVDDDGAANWLRTLDPSSGETVGLVRLPVAGWITAVAFEP